MAAHAASAGLHALAASSAVGGRLVVSAAVPEAARVGLEVMRAGGNAFDAVVAACAAEGVWLPMKCGLGGDLVALTVQEGRAPRALVSIGAGAAALAPGRWPETTGPRSVGLPGAPDGYMALAALGRLPLSDLLAPAIAMAERGARWTPVAVDLTREAEALLRRHNGPNRFLPDGELPVAGRPLCLPGLAEVFRRFLREGHALYRGELGGRLIARLEETGGLLTAADLDQRPAAWAEPLRHRRPDGSLVYATPHPTRGPLLLSALALAEKGLPAPQAFDRARGTYRHEDGGGTSVVTAADAEGNAAVVVHSNSFPQYGSGLLLEELDLVLNNRPGRGFTLDQGEAHWNAPRPGRVPFTTLHAWGFERDGRRLLGATPGGVNQVPWNLQALLALGEAADPFGAGLSDGVATPRWGFAPDGALAYEEDHPDADHGERRQPALSLRSAEQILSLGRPGEPVRAAADPRTGAFALASD